jgi:hypothetical protein
MKTHNLSIRKAVSYLNNDESEWGGFWLPNIQRPFVWNVEQISRLFDSIMREYPISTLLIWKTKEEIKLRRFIDSYHNQIKLTDFYVHENTRPKMMILDGQQRLQSLFIGLKGSYEGKELYFDILSGTRSAPEDIMYRFSFIDRKNVKWPWIRFKEIILKNNKLDFEIADVLKKQSSHPLSDEQNIQIQRNVARARHEFVNQENVIYQVLDSIDNPETYTLDDIVEIFIRANSGGTKLGKSDLLFSLLAASWEDADGEMECLLEELNRGGFDYDRDFVLKTCLALLGKGARYEVNKFRDGKTKEEIISKWPEISTAIKTVRDFVISKTYIRSDKAISSYLALIPIVYYRYHYPKKFASNNGIAEYLLRALVVGVYGGSPDNLIDKIIKNIQENQDFILAHVYEVMRADGRSLEITPDVIMKHRYGSKSLHLFLNLWYRDIDYSPAFDGNGPQVDHIFPQSLLKTVKEINPETGKKNILRYRQEHRDQIANLMLLTADENGFSGKCDTPPHKWLARSRFDTDDAHQSYLDRHLIPNNPELWKIERYDDFIEARKDLIIKKFAYMLRDA